MGRSVSRSRKSASKSPARVKKQMKSPMSEPRKRESYKAKAHSRSRSASKGPKGRKLRDKSLTKSLSRSRSRGRMQKVSLPLKLSPSLKRKLSSPKPSPKKIVATKSASATKAPLVTKTPKAMKSSTEVKTHIIKTSEKQDSPIVKESSVGSSSSSSSSSNVSDSTELRQSRGFERRVHPTTPYEYDFRQRLIRPDSSSSRSPVKVAPKKSVSAATEMYKGACDVGQSVGRSARSACRSVAASRREILVSIALLLAVTLLSYFVLYTDPTKTRAFIQSIPRKIDLWYRRNIARK